jgi:hypothetical protein
MFISELKLTDDQLKTYALVEIEKLLINNGYTLQNFSEELCPDSLLIRDNMNKLIAEEMRYDKEEMRIEHEKLLPCLTIEQRGIYDEIMSAIDLNCGGVFSCMVMVELVRLSCGELYVQELVHKETLFYLLLRAELQHFFYLMGEQLILDLAYR